MIHAEYGTTPTTTTGETTTTVGQPVTPTRPEHPFTGGDVVGLSLVGAGVLAAGAAAARIRGRRRARR